MAGVTSTRTDRHALPFRVTVECGEFLRQMLDTHSWNAGRSPMVRQALLRGSLCPSGAQTDTVSLIRLLAAEPRTTVSCRVSDAERATLTMRYHAWCTEQGYDPGLNVVYLLWIYGHLQSMEEEATYGRV